MIRLSLFYSSLSTTCTVQRYEPQFPKGHLVRGLILKNSSVPQNAYLWSQFTANLVHARGSCIQQQKQNPLVLSALWEGMNTPGQTEAGVPLLFPSATLQVSLVQGGLFVFGTSQRKQRSTSKKKGYRLPQHHAREHNPASPSRDTPPTWPDLTNFRKNMIKTWAQSLFQKVAYINPLTPTNKKTRLRHCSSK